MKARKCPIHESIHCDCLYNQESFDLTITFSDIRKGWGDSRERIIVRDQYDTTMPMLIEGLEKCIEKGYIDLTKTTKDKLVFTGKFRWYRRTFVEPV